MDAPSRLKVQVYLNVRVLPESSITIYAPSMWTSTQLLDVIHERLPQPKPPRASLILRDSSLHARDENGIGYRVDKDVPIEPSIQLFELKAKPEDVHVKLYVYLRCTIKHLSKDLETRIPCARAANLNGCYCESCGRVAKQISKEMRKITAGYTIETTFPVRAVIGDIPILQEREIRRSTDGVLFLHLKVNIFPGESPTVVSTHAVRIVLPGVRRVVRRGVRDVIIEDPVIIKRPCTQQALKDGDYLIQLEWEQVREAIQNQRDLQVVVEYQPLYHGMPAFYAPVIRYGNVVYMHR